MLRGKDQPTGAVTVRANWSDNPWFPSVLEQEAGLPQNRP